jgi:hypothetical protein
MAPPIDRSGPEIIAHRRNTIEKLRATDPAHGVEVDIRSQGNRLVIHHDPFVEGVDFVGWLAHYRHGLLILNVKEEGLEQRLLGLMSQAGIERFFFLDQSFPFLIQTARAGERRCAVRFSEYEAMETALAVAPMIEWAWVDVFTPALPDASALAMLRAARLRLCLVSPELQGRDPESEVVAIRDHLRLNAITIDAVCTKRADLWV